MSGDLWDYFIRDDVVSFQQLLASATYSIGNQKTPGLAADSSSPTILPSSSPLPRAKRGSGTFPWHTAVSRGPASNSGISISRIELNARDQHGRTLLHHIASSRKPTAITFANALLGTPCVDIYAQDWESGWTALHRALYAGNATVAKALIEREFRENVDFNKLSNAAHQREGLVKVRDREGYSPFNVYRATIRSPDMIYDIATVQNATDVNDSDIDSASGTLPLADNDKHEISLENLLERRPDSCGDEVFTFGSNKNLSLGLGDQDDRQFPELVTLTRSGCLIQRFVREYQEQQSDVHSSNQFPACGDPKEPPSLIANRPIKYRSVAMSKFHTAIITDDPESNLFICGYGPGGRLGTGDESTRFNFTCVETGGLASKKIISVALGQDHTLAITAQGEIFSWGSNKFGQLGYSLTKLGVKNDTPVQVTPRQIFNPFKKETVLGAAASAIHSAVFTSSGLYTFGKNEGQLGIVDSDAGSLEIQVLPRRVGASLFNSPIIMVTAIDSATAVLLQNNEVWIFSQYGYPKLLFPLGSTPWFIKHNHMSARHDTTGNHITKIASGGQTICALSSFGEVFTVYVSRPGNPPCCSSTTNPVKIRNSLSSPTRVWSPKRAHMAAKDVDVGWAASIIICTVSGSVWKREERVKSKSAAAEDYKFSRIPGLSRAVAVWSNSFGAFSVIQRECSITKEQIRIEKSTLRHDILPLFPLEAVKHQPGIANPDDTDKRSYLGFDAVMDLKEAILATVDLQSKLLPVHADLPPGTVWISSTLSDARVPIHEFLLSGRSPVLRKALFYFRRAYYFSIPDVLTIEYGQDGQCHIRIQGIDFLTVLCLVFFFYTDSLLETWRLGRDPLGDASRYRLIRAEVIRVAAHLELFTLERASRLMIEPTESLKSDMNNAINDPMFFESADVVIELNGDPVHAHSQVLCRRCPFFNGLFYGHSGGRWISSRPADPDGIIHINLKHIDRALFNFVIRHIYADTEEQLFDEVRLKDLDDFINLVIDVAFVANELMIDRLSQICQKMLGKFVNTRNACYLLNSIQPCAVTKFKDTLLRYVCLNLEDMLVNGLLQDLDEDLLRELDIVCRENQLACYPISRGCNSDDHILKKYPEIFPLVADDRQDMVCSMKLKLRPNTVEPYEGRQRVAPNQKMPVSPAPRLRARTDDQEVSPALRTRQSSSDLMFRMDDVSPFTSAGPVKGKTVFLNFEGHDNAAGGVDHGPSAFGTNLAIQLRRSLDCQTVPKDTRENLLYELRAGTSYEGSELLPSANTSSHIAWGSPILSASKGNLKEIMAEASQARQVDYRSISRSHETSKSITKPSQKERKKLQQQQTQERLTAAKSSREALRNPWKIATEEERIKGTGILTDDFTKPIKQEQKLSMTLRQTVAGTAATKHKAAVVCSEVRKRDSSASLDISTKYSSLGSPSTISSKAHGEATGARLAVQSIRHIPHPDPRPTSLYAPSSQSQSLANIFAQQETEKNEIREAATARHNLEDIQLEQEFQEWWDKESKRVQGQAEAEAEAAAGHVANSDRKKRNRPRKGAKLPLCRRDGCERDVGDNASDISALTQPLSGHDLKVTNNIQCRNLPKQKPASKNQIRTATSMARPENKNSFRERGKKDQGVKDIVA